jgi:hypothetical protein
MADRLLGILRHQSLELSLGILMLEMGLPCPGKETGKLRLGALSAPDRHRGAEMSILKSINQAN